MEIVHISDTHGQKYHTRLEIPKCDVLIHTGDIGGRTSLMELTEFLIWFEKQPAEVKIWVGGNHDLVLDKKWAESREDSVTRMLAKNHYMEAMEVIQSYKVKYLHNSDYVYEGVKFWGSPYTPSFHRQHWAFNADRGQEISKIWSKIPSDVNVLLTHGPVYGILDRIPDSYLEFNEEKDVHKGCKDLLEVIKNRLFNLKLHCSGHIHDQVGVVYEHVSRDRRVVFSNGAVISNAYEQLITKPLIITI